MSDKLILRDGETVEIGSLIEALEATPDREELLEALRALRADRVKEALGQAVKAAQFDRGEVFEEFLRDGEKSSSTVTTYRRECGRLFSWLDRRGVHLLQLDRSTVNRFRDYLKSKYSANTVRVCLASCSSFLSYLEAEHVIDSSPFAGIKYPRRQFRKAVRPDQSRPEPVMSSGELAEIVAELERRSKTAGNRACDINVRESAERMLRVVHVLSSYGLRVSSLRSLEIHDGYISYQIKGGQTRQKALLPESEELLEGKRPFADIAVSTIQNAISRVTRQLYEEGRLRHPYSAHDFRHYYAMSLYELSRDVYAVMRAMDHSTVNTTAVYLEGLGIRPY